MAFITTTLLLVVAASLSTASFPPEVEEEWEEWRERYRKTYESSAEENRSRAAWLRNRDLVLSHNHRADVTFLLDLNQFADLDLAQNQNSSPNTKRAHQLLFQSDVSSSFLPRAPPTSFDWRTRGVISPVKDQGMIGSAAAFATTDALESWEAIKHGRLVELSVAELVDCCSWGAAPGQLVAKIYECVHLHGGLCAQAAYPNTLGQCRNDSCTPLANDVTRTAYVRKGDESEMVVALLRCPLVVYIDASHPSFQLYRGGVYADVACGEQVDHVMLVVGYGQDSSGLQYWILKNSWGMDWGMQGYMLMKRGVNMCGIADFAHYPQ